jgi:hypothetical protein
MTLDELRAAEKTAHANMMYYEAAERGYDRQAASAAFNEWVRAKDAVKNAEQSIHELFDNAEDDSILGLARQIKALSNQL